MDIKESEIIQRKASYHEPETRPPNGGWGWVICFAAFWTNFTVAGTTSSSGVVLLGILDTFQESIAKSAIVVSILAGCTMFGGPVVLLLLMCKFSHRQIIILSGILSAASAVASAFVTRIEILFFTYGISVGISLAISYFAANVILGCYFDTKRALAVGIAFSGTGLGSFLCNYLSEKCIAFYGMRGTFILMGGFFLNLSVYGALCRPLKPTDKSNGYRKNSRGSQDKSNGVDNPGYTIEEERPDNEESQKVVGAQNNVKGMVESKKMKKTVSWGKERSRNILSNFWKKTVLRNNKFLLLLAIYSFWSIGESLLIYLPAYSQSVGVSRVDAALIMSIYGIVSTLSQILLGFLADILHIPVSYLLLVTFLNLTLALVAFPFCTAFWSISICTILFGMGMGFGISLRIVLVSAVLGIKNMSKGYSILTLLVGIWYMLYPIVSGIIYDTFLSFQVIFYIDSSLTFIGAILSCMMIYLQKKGKLNSS